MIIHRCALCNALIYTAQLHRGRSVRGVRGVKPPPYPPQRSALPRLVHCAIAQIYTGTHELANDLAAGRNARTWRARGAAWETSIEGELADGEEVSHHGQSG